VECVICHFIGVAQPVVARETDLSIAEHRFILRGQISCRHYRSQYKSVTRQRMDELAAGHVATVGSGGIRDVTADEEYRPPASSRLVVLDVDALSVRGGLELALVSDLAARGSGKAGPAALLPIFFAERIELLLLALRVPLVDLLALISGSAAKGTRPAAAAALTVRSRARSGSIGGGYSGQKNGHGDNERKEFHPVSVAFVAR
jgi:hypothetical protein